jgi:hypothetical protein
LTAFVDRTRGDGARNRFAGVAAMRIGPVIQIRKRAQVAPWPLEVLQLLEEHHLCAWAHSPDRRRKFGVDLAWHLSKLDDTQVVLLDGTRVVDLTSFCSQLEGSLGFSRIERRIDTPTGVVGALRRRHTPRGQRPVRRRYYIWLDADTLLRRDHRLFGKLVDAITGVAAEHEYINEDLLLLQRAVFVGGPSLDMYAEDPRGQFRTWWSDAGEDPLWRVVTGVDAPKLLRYQIGDEVGA